MTRLPAFAVDGAVANGRLLRTVAYAATSGQVGVVTPGSMKVTASGAAVSIAPGAAVAPTRYSASPAFNSYVVTADAAESLAIPATGSGGGATRYIIARIDDPEFGGQGDPSKVFWRYEQVSSITNLAYPFVPLAKIAQPASTTTITDAMITDLRQVATPRRNRFTLVAPQNADYHYLDTGNFIDFPANTGLNVYIPEWATRAIVRTDVLDVLNLTAHLDGRFVTMIGNHAAYTAERRFDEPWVGNSARNDYTIVAEFAIPPSYRGTEKLFRTRARRTTGTGRLAADNNTQVVYDIEFIEEAQ